MRKTGRAAADWMWAASKSGMTGVAGYCLRTCRRAWDLPSDDPSAIREWESIPESMKVRKKWWLAPVGAPHFWKGGAYGHVTIQSGIKGFVWSTDAPNKDRIGRVSIGWFKKHWGYTYLGWAKEFQSEPLPLEEKPKPVKKAVKKASKPKPAA
jgi:hypothetical protein